ncbi:LETM1 and EF-hand domain-containing protein 1, mitochondrial [Orchesella cincta]|uniref:LETM1 and EF-hand domain-containing protein 1, mitochondrial n=1 Tax=Orchesella cincta TaxID=48709 RepID=A0A1D2NK45_ORCCI|nr:LETM1 and EF-hand domain-containing protein 1, mitochondrial [Orchesella cincta]
MISVLAKSRVCRPASYSNIVRYNIHRFNVNSSSVRWYYGASGVNRCYHRHQPNQFFHRSNQQNSYRTNHIPFIYSDSQLHPLGVNHLVRYIHSTEPLEDGEGNSGSGKKASSKVEETVKVLEKELEKQKQAPVPAVKRPLWKRIQDEILHYYHGFRLLLIDMRISANLIWRVLNGKSLSRREHKQLLRTTSDMFRLVPFSVFIIIPFMELLLPFFIAMFPGMLPSTFQSAKDRESKMKAELKVKLEMAKFLQQTLDEMAPQAKGRSSEDAKDFSLFIEKIRTSGAEVTTEEILKFSKLFEDEITLDSLSRPQLLALSRVIEIPAFGTSTMLRFQLRMKLRRLAIDDKTIEREGIDALDLPELQNACKARGMRAVGVPEDRLRRQLDQWLTLSLHEKVPASLLLLTRAMYLPEHLAPTQLLQATLQALPDSATLQTKAAIGEREGKIDHKTRIELIKEEERKIKEERQEAKKEKELKEELEAAKKEKQVEPAEPEFVGPTPTESRPDVAPFSTHLAPISYYPAEDDHSVAGVISRMLLRKSPPMPSYDDKITADDFDAIEVAIEKLGKKKNVIEQEELQDLKEEMSDYKEDVEKLEQVTDQDFKLKVRESKGARRLFNKLNNMVSKLETRVKTVDVEETKTQFQKQLVATEELMAAVRMIKDVEDPDKLARIANVLSKLDDDSDGKIEVDDLVKVLDVIGREHVDVSSKQLEDIVSLLAKEEVMEEKNAEVQTKPK